MPEVNSCSERSDHAEALFNRGNAFSALEEHEEALSPLDRGGLRDDVGDVAVRRIPAQLRG